MQRFDKNLFKNIEPRKEWKIKSIFENSIKFDNNQETNLSDFMNLVIKKEISIINNKLDYEFVIGKDNNIYSVKEYVEWTKQFKENLENEINPKDLKVGYVYQLENLNKYFIYLGEKFYSSWKFNKYSKKIELTKIKSEHFCYEVYKHDNYDNSQYYEKSSFNLKQKVVKEIKRYDGKLDLNIILNNIKYGRNYVYFDDNKPKEELFLKMKKITMDDLIEINKKSESSFINLFLESQGYFINHNLSIYDTALNDNPFHRQIRKSDFSNVIFLELEDGSFKLYEDKRDYYGYDCLLARITENCDNDYFRIPPNNYYILTV